MRWAEEEGGAEATKLGETVCLLLLIRLSQRLFQRRSTKRTLHTEGASQSMFHTDFHKNKEEQIWIESLASFLSSLPGKM